MKPFNLRTDTYEWADIIFNSYYEWFMDNEFVVLAAVREKSCTAVLFWGRRCSLRLRAQDGNSIYNLKGKLASLPAFLLLLVVSCRVRLLKPRRSTLQRPLGYWCGVGVGQLLRMSFL